MPPEIIAPGPIYVPKGKAREYAHLALNTYFGCGHGCEYCYVWRRFGNKPIKPRPRKAVMMKKLSEQAAKLSGIKERVHLCFSCDPYQALDAEHHLTHEALIILREYDIPFQILTKAGTSVRPDFCFYRSGDAFAVTLTLLDDLCWREWEPHAGNPILRIQNLVAAHEMGIETWVSLEPVLDAQQSLQIIRETHEFVDLYKIGKLNYMEPPEPIDWRDFGIRAIELCESLRKPYFIKAELARFLKDIPFSNTDNRCSDWREHYGIRTNGGE